MCAAVRSGSSRFRASARAKHLVGHLRRQGPRFGLERLEPPGPPRPDPLIRGRTADPYLHPVGTDVVRAARSRTSRPRSALTSPDRPPPGSARSGTRPPRWLDLSSAFSLLHRPARRSGAAEPRVAAAQDANQGEFVLDSNRPTVSTDTHDHAGRGPSRNDAARAATPIASSASARPPNRPARPMPELGSSAVRPDPEDAPPPAPPPPGTGAASPAPSTPADPPPQPPCDARPRRGRRHRPADHRHRVHPASQHHVRQQDLRLSSTTGTGPAAGATPPVPSRHGPAAAGRTTTGPAPRRTPGRLTARPPAQPRPGPGRSLR